MTANRLVEQEEAEETETDTRILRFVILEPRDKTGVVMGGAVDSR
jgi:hypothetical protein